MENGTELAYMADIIRRLAPVQAIFLLGTAITKTKTASIFSEATATTSHTAQYYLLLLTANEDDHATTCLQDKLENNPHLPVALTTIILNTATFLSWAAEGHPFAVNVLRKAEQLYLADGLLLPAITSSIDAHRQEQNNCLHRQTALKVEAFLASADLHRIRKEYKLAAFMLHQAAEQSLRTILIIGTGYRAITHSIDRLLRLCSMCCPQLLDLFLTGASSYYQAQTGYGDRSSFPHGDDRRSRTQFSGGWRPENEKKLFSLLKKAYIDARYKDDYSITYEELAALTEKVKRVKELLDHYK